MTLPKIVLTPTRRQCRCGVNVWRVYTVYNVDIDPTPADARATGPFFERLTDFIVERPWPGDGVPEPRHGGVIHAIHHCPAPFICKWCQSTHKPPTSTDVGSSTAQPNEGNIA